ncbi:MAG: hypothetical protein MK086_08290 [Flavobacteriales bacterium]|nr:hypothetical protein [Flavobacteriales bacterium]
MITNSKLLIDADCPMCKIYGKAFLKFGLIENDVLSSYQQVEESISKSIDMDRAKSEIALIDLTNNQVVYGIDAFTRILTRENSLLRKTVKRQPLRFFVKLVYSLISLNRHVIVRPSSTCSSPLCSPELHRGYRTTYGLITAFFTAFILSNYFRPVFADAGLELPPYFEYAMCLGQIVWQGFVISIVNKNESWDYLGHVSTISLIGAILLIPPYLIASIFGLPSLYLLGAFGLVVVIMIQEHVLRTNRLGLGHALTFTWIAYRLLILFIISILFL